MEDEPGKASMHADRPSFCSELPSRGVEEIEDIRPRSMERLHFGGAENKSVLFHGEGLDRKDQATARSLLADDLSRTRQHPNEQVPRPVGAVRIPSVGWVEHEAGDAALG